MKRIFANRSIFILFDDITIFIQPAFLFRFLENRMIQFFQKFFHNRNHFSADFYCSF